LYSRDNLVFRRAIGTAAVVTATAIGERHCSAAAAAAKYEGSGYQKCQCAKTVHRILHNLLNASLSLEVPERENKSR
jgi:hypothetical protein